MGSAVKLFQHTQQPFKMFLCNWWVNLIYFSRFALCSMPARRTRLRAGTPHFGLAGGRFATFFNKGEGNDPFFTPFREYRIIKRRLCLVNVSGERN